MSQEREIHAQSRALVRWLVAQYDVPDWNSIRVLDTSDQRVRFGAIGLQLPKGNLVLVDQFADRFDELLGTRSWLNLSAFGIYDGDLVLGIEVPEEATRVTGRAEIEFSSPPLDRSSDPKWNLRLSFDD